MDIERKAVISNRIYFRPTNTEIESIRNELTYKIESKAKTKGGYKPVEIIKNYKVHSHGLYSVPVGRQDLIPPGLIIIDKRVYNEVPFPLPKANNDNAVVARPPRVFKKEPPLDFAFSATGL